MYRADCDNTASTEVSASPKIAVAIIASKSVKLFSLVMRGCSLICVTQWLNFRKNLEQLIYLPEAPLWKGCGETGGQRKFLVRPRPPDLEE
jgi:hypothetical protein